MITLNSWNSVAPRLVWPYVSISTFGSSTYICGNCLITLSFVALAAHGSLQAVSNPTCPWFLQALVSTLSIAFPRTGAHCVVCLHPAHSPVMSIRKCLPVPTICGLLWTEFISLALWIGSFSYLQAVPLVCFILVILLSLVRQKDLAFRSFSAASLWAMSASPSSNFAIFMAIHITNFYFPLAQYIHGGVCHSNGQLANCSVYQQTINLVCVHLPSL